ncbi:MAG: sigma-70 family RNA polymerase sigma factor [Acidobacteria bacterium]|nr:sigma-70 family RNA polymerase sigma factor [Acidobacteriota bacterium]
MQNPAERDAQELEWIELAQRGNREAFGALVERYQRRVFALIFRVTGERDQVEDLSQEVFLKAYRAMRGYNQSASFGTWLSRIAVNHCYDYLRARRGTQNRLESFDGSPEDGESPARTFRASGPDPERAALLRDMVSKLLAHAPEEDRMVMALKELDGMSVEEIAEIMELKVGTVKVRLHRARKRMLEDFQRMQGRR